MVYATVSDYINVYSGDPGISDGIHRWLARASDEIDRITRRRLRAGISKDAREDVIKATCAVAEILYHINEQIESRLIREDAEGHSHGAVSSVSSGSESISYSNSGDNVYANAADDIAVRDKLIYNAAAKYLAYARDMKGVGLLYAGAL